ncbi:MAG: hypothetical protein Q8L34_06480 [Candidatus Woesearchaeota archaeon]|nr:hypothetical protein [Candidatus Woesearchaeota archaeon]
MTTTTQNEDQEIDLENLRLAGTFVGACATLISLNVPPLAPIIGSVVVGAIAASATKKNYVAYGLGITAGLVASVAADIGAWTIPVGGAIPLAIDIYSLHRYDKTVRIRKFATSGLLTAALLTGGYFLGRHQSSITNIIQQEQGIQIKQGNGRTTSYQRQADGAYIPLEDRLPK